VVLKTRDAEHHERYVAEVGALARLEEIRDGSHVPRRATWLSSRPWSIDAGSGKSHPFHFTHHFCLISSTPVGIPLDAVCNCSKEVRDAIVEGVEDFKVALKDAQNGERPFRYSFVDMHTGNLALRVSPEQLQEMATCTSLSSIVETLKLAEAFVVDVESLNAFGTTPERIYYREECFIPKVLDAETDLKNLDWVTRLLREDKSYPSLPLSKKEGVETSKFGLFQPHDGGAVTN
jgi:hypothetical protein